jgi:hypothetical protein
MKNEKLFCASIESASSGNQKLIRKCEIKAVKAARSRDLKQRSILFTSWSWRRRRPQTPLFPWIYEMFALNAPPEKLFDSSPFDETHGEVSKL